MRKRRRVASTISITVALLATATVSAQTPTWQPHESTEAAKVAGWVRELAPTAPDEAHFAVIGGISTVHIGGPPTQLVRTNGPAALYDDPSRLREAEQMLANRAATYAATLGSGGLTWFRDVQNLPWGLIETSPGVTHFELSDTVIRALGDEGLHFVGAVMPYAAWELETAGYPPSTDSMCTRLLSEDFFYLQSGGRMDRLRDTSGWLRYLDALVERYDGDGVEDMPGLSNGIDYWQIHNEPEGDRCGGFRNDIGAFVDLMRESWQVIHAQCPSCKVLQGGAGIPLWRENEIAGGTFWRDFAAMGGAQWVDVIAVHYNDGKVDGGSIENFEIQIHRMRELLGDEKPVWVTEFGVFVDDGGKFMAMPEHDAAAWYVRFYAAGLAAGVERFFSDAPSFVGYPDATIRLPWYVNQLLEAKLGGFSIAEKVADGQYRFVVNGRVRWIVWTTVPPDITGRVLVTDLYGNETVVDASTIAPSESNPLILTPATRRKHPVRR